MSIHLIVSNDFAHYVKGQRITDPSEVKNILSSHNELHVRKITAPDDPAPAVPATPVPVVR